jgi:hypothetical protein
MRTGETAESPSDETAELAAYHRIAFDFGVLGEGVRLPLADEPFVDFWRPLVADARGRGAWPALVERLPQLRFPIAAGISDTDPYRAATRRGVPPADIPEATGLALERPEDLELQLHPSAAGHIPLLLVRHRPDFVTLLQALAHRNEPRLIPTGQGALMVSGYNNWCRISELKRQWEARSDEKKPPTWGDELTRLQGHKELYQDCFILLSDGPYSAVLAADLALDEATWRERSLVLRRDHECAHYFTLRLFGSMRNHLQDELMADFAGLVGAFGQYRAEWFLRFLGAGAFDRPGRRLDLYRGNPPLADAAFAQLQHQVAAAARNLERFDQARERSSDPHDTARVLTVLARFSIEELAKEGAEERLATAVVRRP